MTAIEQTYGSLDNIRIVTLAPELDGAMNVISELTQRGITVALGHSMGKLKDGEDAVHKGANLITHLFNAMLPVSFLISASNVYSYEFHSNSFITVILALLVY